jgi:hypothetical protein
MRHVLTALSFVLLAGCAATPRVSVDRKVYHNISDRNRFAGKTYALEFTKAEQADSLEMKAHAQVLTNFLGGMGMKPAGDQGAKIADYVVRIRFGIGKENMLGGSSSSSSSITAAGVSVSSSSSLYTRTEYTRSFDLIIHEGTKLRAGDKLPIYEGQALSEGGSNDTTRLFPILVSSLMHDFPSKSGDMERGIEFELW